MVQLAYDKITNELKTINQVARGLKCNCKCSKCGKDLVARKGIKNEHSFAHYTNTACEGETDLHLLAKDVLKKNKKLKINFYVKKEYDLEPKAEIIEFDLVETEEYKSEGGDRIKPDATLKKGDNILFVEFLVTHPVDEKKKEKIKRIGIKTIEIDLNSIEPIKDNAPNVSDMQLFLEKSITFREWIFNSELEELFKWKEGNIPTFMRMLKEGYSPIKVYSNWKYNNGFVFCPKEQKENKYGNSGKLAFDVCRYCEFYHNIKDRFGRYLCGYHLAELINKKEN